MHKVMSCKALSHVVKNVPELLLRCAETRCVLLAFSSPAMGLGIELRAS
jgi:hypothetical protein